MGRDEQLATRVDEETKLKFRVAAAKRDTDMSDLLRELVDNFLEEEEEAEKGNQSIAAAD